MMIIIIIQAELILNYRPRAYNYTELVYYFTLPNWLETGVEKVISQPS